MSNSNNNLDKVDLFRRRFHDQFIDDGDEEDAVSSVDREMCRKGRAESSSPHDKELERSIVYGSRRKNTKNERATSKEAAKLNAASMCPYQRSCAMDIFSSIMIDDSQHHQLPNASKVNAQETTSSPRSLRYQRSNTRSVSFIASSLPPINDEVANNAIEVTQSIHQRIFACFVPHIEEEADNKASVKSTSTTTIPSLQKTTTFDTTSSDQPDSLESDGIEVELGDKLSNFFHHEEGERGCLRRRSILICVVVTLVLIICLGMVVYMFGIDSKQRTINDKQGALMMNSELSGFAQEAEAITEETTQTLVQTYFPTAAPTIEETRPLIPTYVPTTDWMTTATSSPMTLQQYQTSLAPVFFPTTKPSISQSQSQSSTSPSATPIRASSLPTANPTIIPSSSVPTVNPTMRERCNAPASAYQSSLVYCKDGQLQYKPENNGHRIPDFGKVGYRYGKALPNVPIRYTISPIDGDNTAHIQAAIDLVARSYEPDENGIRGAVKLSEGVFTTNDIIYLNHDGVVLQGSGSGSDPSRNTVIRSTRTGNDATVFHLGVRDLLSSENWDGAVAGSVVSILPRHIPIGEQNIPVSDASPFQTGDLVVIRQVRSDRWYDAVDDGGVVNTPGWKERAFDWMDITYVRFVTAVGNSVTIDAPLYHMLNADHGDLLLYKYNSTSFDKTIQRDIGIEDMSIDIEFEGKDASSSDDIQHTQRGVMIRGLIDGWIRNVAILHFAKDGVILHRSSRITIQDSVVAHPVSPTTGGYKYGFTLSVGAQQILIKDSIAISTRHGFILNGSTRSSGVVVLRGELRQNIGSSEGHRQWSLGVLFDSCRVTSAPTSHTAFLLGNRGDWGTSHGWASVNSVIWNTHTYGYGDIVVQKPPTAQNFVIGSTGPINRSAEWPGHWGYVERKFGSRQLYPPSLYEAQRADR